MSVPKPTAVLKNKAIDSIALKIRYKKRTAYVIMYPTSTMNHLFNVVAHSMGWAVGDFKLTCCDQALTTDGTVETAGLEDGDTVVFHPKIDVENAKFPTFEPADVTDYQNDPNVIVNEA